MSMRPTRRGYAVVAVVVGALLAGSVFGARALDAVVLPGVVALVAAAVQLRRRPNPGFDRTLPPADVAGTTGTVTLELDGDRASPVTVRDRLPAGVDVADTTAGRGGNHAVVDAAVGGDPVRYEVVARRRGEHVVGPATVVATDVFGLLKRSTVVDRRDTLVAFPRIGTLPSALSTALQAAYHSREAARREEFDDLRPYVRGDALRDIHWKSSARHDELMIREYADRADPERVTVAAGVEEGARGEGPDGADAPADRMADAAATVVVSLVRGGASVMLATPSGNVDAAPGRVRPALRHLAVVDGGPLPIADADVVVTASGGAASIRFDGREHCFEHRADDAIDRDAVSEVVGGAPAERPADGTDPAPDAGCGRGLASDGSGRVGGHGPPDGPERGDAG